MRMMSKSLEFEDHRMRLEGYDRDTRTYGSIEIEDVKMVVLMRGAYLYRQAEKKHERRDSIRFADREWSVTALGAGRVLFESITVTN